MRRNPVHGPDRWAPLLPADDPPADRDYTVQTRIWRYAGAGGWHFARLSPEQSAQIKSRFASSARGWGSIHVHVRIGHTAWSTSLFPDRKSGTYLFAIKAEVRKAEQLADGDVIEAQLRID